MRLHIYRVAVCAVVACAGVVVAAGAPAAAAPVISAAPHVRLSPASGPPTSTITVSGSGFGAHQAVNV
jgi:hypothetical protein